jgi:PilZ domain
MDMARAGERAEARRAARVPMALDVTLMRRRGNPVVGRTEDLAAGGARVIVDRPPAVDEELLFDLVTPTGHVDGRARVVRQQRPDCYALRFVELEAAAATLLSGVLATQ